MYNPTTKKHVSYGKTFNGNAELVKPEIIGWCQLVSYPTVARTNLDPEYITGTATATKRNLETPKPTNEKWLNIWIGDRTQKHHAVTSVAVCALVLIVGRVAYPHYSNLSASALHFFLFFLKHSCVPLRDVPFCLWTLVCEIGLFFLLRLLPLHVAPHAFPGVAFLSFISLWVVLQPLPFLLSPGPLPQPRQHWKQ